MRKIPGSVWCVSRGQQVRTHMVKCSVCDSLLGCSDAAPQQILADNGKVTEARIICPMCGALVDIKELVEDGNL